MARILLAVSGGIAAYKSLDVLRLLQRAGHDVTVLMTRNAERFVGAASFAALSGRPVASPLFGPATAPGYDHLDLARGADLVLVCPATANTLARMAGGLAGDLLGSVYLATTSPVVVAPAMNTRMWEHPATRDNLARLVERGAHVVPPDTGLLADGDVGEGRLAAPTAIVGAVDAVLAGVRTDLAGVRVLVTGGGTREPIDSVRYVGNRSSGKMAVAVAAAASARGATVTLVAANLSVPVPPGIRTVPVETAAELGAATREAFGSCDLLVMAAAVADYRPVRPSEGKLDKSKARTLAIELERTEDVLSDLAARRSGQVLVGFAAEHGPSGLDRARAKRARKGVDILVHNDVSAAGIGFEGDDNAVTILGPGDAETAVARSSKRACAERILDAAAALIPPR